MQKKRTWTAEQKLVILKEAEQKGVTATGNAARHFQFQPDYTDGFAPTRISLTRRLSGGGIR